MKNKTIITLYLFLMVINMFNFVRSEINISDPAYIEVLNEFNKGKEWVPVMIGVSSEDVRDEVISSLSDTGFKLEGKSLLGKSFSGKMTEKGLSKIINNSNIEWVNLKKGLTTVDNKSINNPTQNESLKPFRIGKKINFDWLLFLLVVVIIFVVIGGILKIKKISNKKTRKKHLFCLIIFILSLILLNVNLVESKIVKPIISDPEYLKVLNEFNKGKEWVPVIIGVTSEDVREDVITSLSVTDIRYLRKLLIGDSFSAEVSKEGLNKLVNDSNVKWVNLDVPLSTNTQNNKSPNSLNLRYFIENKKTLLFVIGIIILIIIVIIFEIRRKFYKFKLECKY